MASRGARVVPYSVAALLVAATVAVVTAAPPARAGAPTFLPHRAVYGITLGKSRGDGSISQAMGKLEFEWADVCSGWAVNQRTFVELVSKEGRVIEFGWKLNALESKDGLTYRFFIHHINPGGVSEDKRGEAKLRGPGQGGTAAYSEPMEREIKLPKGTLFPTAHTFLLLQAVERADSPLWRMVFDGSGEQGLFGVNAVLTKTLSPDDAPRLDLPVMRQQKSWRLQLAYFGDETEVTVPEHEQAFRLFANGVIDEMLLDYGDFTLRADLESLDPLPPPQC